MAMPFVVLRGIAAALLILFAVSLAQAQEFQRTMMTGGPKGTYIQIGRDLAGLMGECGLALNVSESAGSLENLVAVKTKLYTQFGIVQSDVLEYVKTYSANDPQLKRSLYGMRIMFPLYNEEVHVLARTDIQSLKDLNGRKVAIGKVDSGTWLTATLVLDIMKVGKAERLPIASDEALPKLIAGEIDAFFYVAGRTGQAFRRHLHRRGEVPPSRHEGGPAAGDLHAFADSGRHLSVPARSGGRHRGEGGADDL